MKIAKANLAIKEQELKMAKSQHTPSITFSANAFYLGDALVLNPDWSKLQTVDLHNFENSFSVQYYNLLKSAGVL